jgi:hypothetical protein
MIDRDKARREILAAVREMAAEFPEADYCFAREGFGLLGRIKTITERVMPTARQCWEFVGLDRSRLVDEFHFAQEDAVRRAAA